MDKTRTFHRNECAPRDRFDNRTSKDESLEFDNLNESEYSINDFDPSLDKVVKGRLNIEDVVKRHRRIRRSVAKKDTVEHVTKIMESIEEELDDLKVYTCNITNLRTNVSSSFSYLGDPSTAIRIKKNVSTEMFGSSTRRRELLRNRVPRSQRMANFEARN